MNSLFDHTFESPSLNNYINQLGPHWFERRGVYTRSEVVRYLKVTEVKEVVNDKRQSLLVLGAKNCGAILYFTLGSSHIKDFQVTGAVWFSLAGRRASCRMGCPRSPLLGIFHRFHSNTHKQWEFTFMTSSWSRCPWRTPGSTDGTCWCRTSWSCRDGWSKSGWNKRIILSVHKRNWFT